MLNYLYYLSKSYSNQFELCLFTDLKQNIIHNFGHKMLTLVGLYQLLLQGISLKATGSSQFNYCYLFLTISFVQQCLIFVFSLFLVLLCFLSLNKPFILYSFSFFTQYIIYEDSIMETGSLPTHSSPILTPQHVLAYFLVLQMYRTSNQSKPYLQPTFTQHYLLYLLSMKIVYLVLQNKMGNKRKGPQLLKAYF